MLPEMREQPRLTPITAQVQEWRLLHQSELLQNWDLARDQLPLPRIAPLE
jgi:hypothetical protein